MGGFVDPFEEFKRKKEAAKAAAQPVKTATAAEISSDKPQKFDTGRSEKLAADAVQKEVQAVKKQEILGYTMAGDDPAKMMTADQVTAGISQPLERLIPPENRALPPEELAKLKPAGFETHTAAPVATATPCEKPKGFQTVTATRETAQEQPPAPPKGFSKF